MKIRNFVLGMVSTNCYLVIHEETRQCVLIDAAVYSSEITEQIRREGLDFRGILLTHGHFDHIMGIEGFVKEFPGLPVYARIPGRPIQRTAGIWSLPGCGSR